jgi:hypothetical protein
MKKRELFVAKVRELLLSVGANQAGDDFVLDTRVGRLTLHPDTQQAIGLGAVYARFDDPHAALQLVDCNRFSGKWNARSSMVEPWKWRWMICGSAGNAARTLVGFGMKRVIASPCLSQ